MTETPPAYGDTPPTRRSIDPDKLLALCQKRHHDGGVTLSWPMMLHIVEQLRSANPMPPPTPVTDAMVEAAAEAHMPFGDMRAAIEAAIAEGRS